MLNFSALGGIFNWLEVGNDGGIIGYRCIRLDDNRGVSYGQRLDACGRWSYAEKLGSRHIYIEFSWSRTPWRARWRKHILSEYFEGHYMLLPYDEFPEDYDDEALWHHTSVMHSNENTIFMSRVEMPWIENEEGLPDCFKRLLHLPPYGDCFAER